MRKKHQSIRRIAKSTAQRKQIASKALGIALACLMIVSMFGVSLSTVSAGTFNIGDTVEVTTNLNVRTGAGTGYLEITDPDYHSYAPQGTIGKILSGPSSADGYIWWKVDFGPGLYSGWSVEDGLKKVSQPPSPPRNLTATLGNGEIDLSWDPPSSDGGSPLTCYKIYRGTSPNGESFYYRTTTTGTTFRNTAGLTDGVTYYYKVKAVNAVGDSDFSNEVSATPLAPDIRTPISPIDFGTVTVGSRLNKTTTIFNDGNATLTINSIARTLGSSDFTYIGPSTPFNIGAGGSQTVTVRFAPTSVGSKRATFTVSSNDPDEAGVTFSVSGGGVTPETPQITGIDPAQPEAQPTRQWLTIHGTGFVSESQVILRIGTNEYTIPPERTEFVSSTQIKVFVGLTDYGTWTAQVVNPSGSQSNIFAFEVIHASDSTSWGLDSELVSAIEQHAPDYYNPNWNVSRSQFKAWIALISLREAGMGRYAAHSQYGGGYNGDRFNHVDVGDAFRFSTGVGPFQLDRGGDQGNASESWGTMPTIDKLTPETSLLSVLRWHRDSFGAGATLVDFSRDSAWVAVQPGKQSEFESTWFQITNSSWNDSKNQKLEVGFHPPSVEDPFENSIQYLSKIYWSLPPKWDGYFDTWLISARNWEGGVVSVYYYTLDEESGWEIWVDSDPEDKLIYYFEREYMKWQFPENRISTEGRVALAGLTASAPVLDPTRTVSKLRDTINRRLQQQVTYPLYLLNPDSFTTAVTTGWLTLTSPLTGNLTEKYDEFYGAGIDFGGLRTNALINASQSLRRGDIASAEKYLQKSETYGKLSKMNFDAAFEVYIGNLDAAETLAQGIKDGCQTAVKFGLKFVNPTAAEAADFIYDVVDFGLEYRFGDQEQAVKDFVLKRAVTEVFNHVGFEELGGKTISDWTKNRTGKYLFPTLSKLIESEEGQWALSKIIKEGVADIAEFEVRNAVTSIIDAAKGMVNYGEAKLKSPGELRVYDSQGQVSGLVNEEVKNEIPRSVYDNGTVIIFYPMDSYSYEIAGTDEGAYGLEITSVENGKASNFTDDNVSITLGITYLYTIDLESINENKVMPVTRLTCENSVLSEVCYMRNDNEKISGKPIIWNMSVVDPTLSHILYDLIFVYDNKVVSKLSSAYGAVQKEFIDGLLYDVLLSAFNDSLNIQFYNVDLTCLNNKALGVDKFTVPNQIIYAVKLNVSELGQASTTVKLSYENFDKDLIKLYKCDDWNFEERRCNSTWYEIPFDVDEENHLVVLSVSSFSGFKIEQQSRAPVPPSTLPEIPWIALILIVAVVIFVPLFFYITAKSQKDGTH